MKQHAHRSRVYRANDHPSSTMILPGRKRFGALAFLAAVMAACGARTTESRATGGPRADIEDGGDAGIHEILDAASDGSVVVGRDKPVVQFTTPPPPCVDFECPDGGKCVGYFDEEWWKKGPVCVFDGPCNHLICPPGTICGQEETAVIPTQVCFGGPERPQDIPPQ